MIFVVTCGMKKIIKLIRCFILNEPFDTYKQSCIASDVMLALQITFALIVGYFLLRTELHNIFYRLI